MKNRIIALVSLTLVLTVALCLTPVLAKYIITQGEQSQLDSPEFYFTGDYLSADEVPPIYEISGDSVNFSIRNYLDSLRVTKTDISYTVEAEGGTLSATSGTLTGGSRASADITLTYDGEDTQKSITLTVSSSTPYRKNLQATFVFVKDTGLQFEIRDGEESRYAELFIYMGSTAKQVTLSWNKENLLIDETNDYVFGKLNNDKNAVTINNIAPDTTVKIFFFKTNIHADYSCGMQDSDGTIKMP